MKKKALSIIISLVATATLFTGCGGADTATADSSADTSAPAATEAAASDDGDSAPASSSGGDLEFKIVVKSFQSSYWQAAVQVIQDSTCNVMTSFVLNPTPY